MKWMLPTYDVVHGVDAHLQVIAPCGRKVRADMLIVDPVDSTLCGCDGCRETYWREKRFTKESYFARFPNVPETFLKRMRSK